MLIYIFIKLNSEKIKGYVWLQSLFVIYKYPKENTAYSSGYCTCSGSGDPHYYTPDGAVIHFMGTCKYTLWQSTIPNDSCEFRVETKNERRYGYTHVAYTRMIDFYTGNTQVRILQGRNVLVSE